MPLFGSGYAGLGLTGVSMSGSMADVEKSNKLACETTELNGCNSLSSPHFGGHIGFGFGVMFAVSNRLRLRADLLGDIMATSLRNIDGPNYTGQATVTEPMTLARGFMLVGMEI